PRRSRLSARFQVSPQLRRTRVGRHCGVLDLLQEADNIEHVRGTVDAEFLSVVFDLSHMTHRAVDTDHLTQSECLQCLRALPFRHGNAYGHVYLRAFKHRAIGIGYQSESLEILDERSVWFATLHVKNPRERKQLAAFGKVIELLALGGHH